jgi:hypothetical protein
MAHQTNVQKYIEHQSLVESILAWFRLANETNSTSLVEGMEWYRNARAFCHTLRRQFACTLDQAVGVVAALSPGTNWERNKVDAVNTCRDGIKATVTTYGPNLRKATDILSSDTGALSILGGSKVRSFFHCILHGDRSRHVCLDRHAVRVALPWVATDKQAATVLGWARAYDVISDAYRDAADILGIAPHQLQAVTWCEYRNRGGDLEAPDNTQHELPF